MKRGEGLIIVTLKEMVSESFGDGKSLEGKKPQTHT